MHRFPTFKHFNPFRADAFVAIRPSGMVHDLPWQCRNTKELS